MSKHRHYDSVVMSIIDITTIFPISREKKAKSKKKKFPKPFNKSKNISKIYSIEATSSSLSLHLKQFYT